MTAPVMTPRRPDSAEERRLWRRVERGDAAAREEMILRNLGLVRSLAARDRGRGVAFDDLVQEGTVGLMRAVERFDHRRELRFSTYAVWWIRRALSDAVADAATIRIPPGARRQLAAIRQARDELRAQGVAHPTDAAVARRAGIRAESLRRLAGTPYVATSLDEPFDDDGTLLGDRIADDGATDAARRAEDRDASDRVRSMVGLLPARHREVLERRFGLDGASAQGHGEIGARLGVGEDRSRQLEREALHRLRTLGGGLRDDA